MRILLIGGNGFIGRFVVAALQRQGHTLALFHRGTTAAPDGVEQILGDRNQLNASAAELKRFAPDVVIDFVISSGAQAEELVNIFRGVTRRVVMLSSIDVYRAIANRSFSTACRPWLLSARRVIAGLTLNFLYRWRRLRSFTTRARLCFPPSI